MRYIIRNTSGSVIIYADYEGIRVELQDWRWSRSSLDRGYDISSTLGVIEIAMLGSFVPKFSIFAILGSFVPKCCIFTLSFGRDIPSASSFAMSDCLVWFGRREG